MMDLLKEAWYEDPMTFAVTAVTGIMGSLAAFGLTVIAFVW